MKKTLLQLNTSLCSGGGQSTRLANEFVARWREGNPGSTVIVRDLAREPVPHLTAERFQAFLSKASERTPSDTQTGHVRNFLGLLGITDVEFVYAEGLAISNATREAALVHARQAIERLNPPQREPLAA